MLLVVLCLLEPESKLRRKDVLPMLGLGCFGIGGAQTAFTFGVSLTSAASTGLVFATVPCGVCYWVSCSGWSGPGSRVSSGSPSWG